MGKRVKDGVIGTAAARPEEDDGEICDISPCSMPPTGEQGRRLTMIAAMPVVVCRTRPANREKQVKVPLHGGKGSKQQVEAEARSSNEPSQAEPARGTRKGEGVPKKIAPRPAGAKSLDGEGKGGGW